MEFAFFWLVSDVAVVGLPDPRKDHAVIMARFARDCMQTVGDLTKKLEVTLGPDTGDLQIRIGLHSGPGTCHLISLHWVFLFEARWTLIASCCPFF